jgi:hypothetical protein
MKKSILFLCFAASILFVKAQNEVDIYYRGNIVNNSVVTVYGNMNESSFEIDLSLGNNTNSGLTLFARRTVISEVEGTANSFCYAGMCFSPFTDTATTVASIEHGAIMESAFQGDYYPSGIGGVTTVTYEFFDNTTLDHRVAAELTVNYLASGDFSILDGDITVVNESTLVEFSSDVQVGVLEKQLKIVNNTDETMELYVRRIVSEEVSGSENSFCFGETCYPSSTDTSINVLVLDPGAVDASFRADYLPNGNAGKTTVTYEFFTLAKGVEEVRESVTVIFNISGVGIGENALAIGRTYPNPAVSSVTIEYKLNPSGGTANLLLRNITGQTLNLIPVNRYAGKAELDVSGIVNGVYTLSLIDGNRVIANKKIVVSH